MSKKVIIVGGGIAGLTAGVYARQSGLDATIFEMHSIPGGNSTSWKRKGYLFEGGMHWLTGSSEAAPLNKIWKEIGALKDNNPIYNRDPFLTYCGETGAVKLYRDPEKLERHLLSVSPGDAEAIRLLVKDIKTLSKLSMPVMDIKGVRVKHKSSPPLSMLFGLVTALPRMNKLNKITAGEYTDRFKHPEIRALLKQVVGTDAFTASSTIFTLAGLAAGDSGYPKGGSLRMAQNIANEFIALGGVIKYNSKVERVCVENGRAAGVIVNGTTYKADSVIVTADTLTAIDKLFGAPLHEPWMDEMRANIKPLNCTFICLGVNADLRDLPENSIYPLANPFTFGGVRYETIGFNNYANFDGYAPEDCAALTCFLGGDTYDEWKKAREDGSYEDKKRELAEIVIEKLGQVIPQARGRVEVWDIATPLTYERYCGTYRGSWMSIMTPEMKRQQYPCKSDSIKNLYFAGQRIMLPGGLPVAVTTGRQAVQYICKDEDILFQGSI